MSRLVKVISPNGGSGWYWEVRTSDGKMVERGVAETHANALSQATAAKTAAMALDDSPAQRMIGRALG